MNVNNEPTLSFIAEWFDSDPQVTKKYLLKYYPSTQEVEMKGTSTRTKFLKRTKMDNQSLTKSDFYIGATIILFSRDLKLVDYGDNYTRELLYSLSETSVVLLTPNASGQAGTIVKLIEEADLTLVNMKTFRIEDDLIFETASMLGLDQDDLKLHHSNKDDHSDNMNDEMNYCIAIEFRGEKCIERLLTTSSIIQQTILHKNNDKWTNILIAASDPEKVKLWKDLFITCKHPPTAVFNTRNNNDMMTTMNKSKHSSSLSCIIIKPHAIKARMAGAIMNDILHKKQYKISAMQIFHLDRIHAVEFYEAYKTAVKNFYTMVDELCSGPILVLEVCCDVDEFRNNVAGPYDVEMAKSLYPDTIRAKFGKDRIQNAIHCTDLPEESENELSYFFDILYDAD